MAGGRAPNVRFFEHNVDPVSYQVHDDRSCDHMRRDVRLIMSLRGAHDHDAGASCRAIAGLDRAPVQAMGIVGIGPRPERAWHVLHAGRGQG